MHLEAHNPSIYVGGRGYYPGVSPSTLLGILRKGRLVVICAEPGYFSSELVKETLNSAIASDGRAFYRDCSSISGEAMSDTLSRLSRQITNKTRGTEDEVFAFIDWAAPSDEADVFSQARSISKMLNRGAAVLVTMLPEARQLIEALPDHVLLTSDGLSDRVFLHMAEGDSAPGIDPFTLGVPALVASLRDSATLFDSTNEPYGYSTALRSLVDAGLRASLCEEERLLRFCISLLGEGSFDDLRASLGDFDAGYLSEIASWAPLYGVDGIACKFRCVTARSLGWARLDTEALISFSAEHEDVYLSCLRMLCRAGEYRRVACLLAMGTAYARLKIASEWGPELLDCGFIELLGGILSGEKESDGDEGGDAWCLRRAVRALGYSRSDPELTGGGSMARLNGLSEDSQLCLGFIGLRARLMGRVPTGIIMSGGNSALQRRLALHNEVSDLLLSGRFSDAMRVLAGYEFAEEIGTVSECLLRIDLEIARVFSCDGDWNNRASLDACKEYLASRGYAGLLGYAHLGELAFEALGSNPKGSVGSIRSRAAKAGDALVLVSSLVAESMTLLRRRPSAYILANIQSAGTRCADLGWEYAARVVGVLEQVAQSRLGGPSGLYEVERGDALAEVSNLVHDAIRDVAEDLVPRPFADRPVPRDELWLYITLSDGMGDFSVAIAEQIPAEWRRAMEIARRNCLGDPVDAAQRRRDPELAGSPERDASPKKVRANLFGDFSLWVGDKRVSDWSLAGRNAKTFIECLALQKGYVASRGRLARLIWPDIETNLQANQRIYAATSTVRKALAYHGLEDELFVMNKATKTLALAPDLFECDVDEFYSCARDAVESTGDARTCAAALRTECLYAGDLCIPAGDPEGFLAERQEKLRGLYVEAMVSGSEAALRLSRRRLAARLANNALVSDPYREDAMVVLIAALRTSGRDSEAQRRYLGYAKMLAKHKKTPSQRLKAALEEPPGLALSADAGAAGWA